MGAIALGGRRPDEALALLDRGLARGDREVTTLSNRALALEALGRTREAAETWGDVATRAAGTAVEARARARQQQLAAGTR
jgi:hypothetical protein